MSLDTGSGGWQPDFEAPRPDYKDQRKASKAEIAKKTIEAITANWRDSTLEHVYNDDDNGDLLDKLIKRAKKNYVPGNETWPEKLRTVQRELVDVDPDDVEGIKEILTKHIASGSGFEGAEGEEEDDDEDDEDIDEEEEE